MTNVRHNLIGARNLIEKGWTQGAYAEGPDGLSRHAIHKEACSFCLNGALYHVVGDKGGNREKIQAEIRALGFDEEGAGTLWNDKVGRTKREVLLLFDEAIRRLE